MATEIIDLSARREMVLSHQREKRSLEFDRELAHRIKLVLAGQTLPVEPLGDSLFLG